jgi:hypothetical protein
MKRKKILSDIEEMIWGFEYGESFNLRKRHPVFFGKGRAYSGIMLDPL